MKNSRITVNASKLTGLANRQVDRMNREGKGRGEHYVLRTTEVIFDSAFGAVLRIYLKVYVKDEYLKIGRDNGMKLEEKRAARAACLLREDINDLTLED